MYSSDKNANIMINRLELDFAIISEWFYENSVVPKPVKCHFSLSALLSHLQIFPSTII